MNLGVWAELIGQDRVVEIFRAAVQGGAHAMTHAWLITGPPGSGRSNVARSFAAALQCERGGCGECNACRTSLSGSHPDVTLVQTELLSIGVDQIGELVLRAAMRPTSGPYQVIVIEDADRVTARGAPALLKAIEEPAPRTVWLLCAPTPDDVIHTIRSRCRLVELATPNTDAIAQLLVQRDQIPEELAAFAARVSQGHIGRARHLARDEEARRRRAEVLRIPGRLNSLGACLQAAANVIAAASEEAALATEERDARERAELSQALGLGTKGVRASHATAALRELEEQQKTRAKRLQRDALDRVLTELTAFFRDVLSLQTGAGTALINAEEITDIETIAARTAPEATVRKLDAILACRTALETNVAPLLAMETLMISFLAPSAG